MKHLSCFVFSLAALLSFLHSSDTVNAVYVTSGTSTKSSHPVFLLSEEKAGTTVIENGNDAHTLLSFNLTGSAKRRFLASDANYEHSYQSHDGSDIHVDSETESMVVHVVYEDICKHRIFIF